MTLLALDLAVASQVALWIVTLVIGVLVLILYRHFGLMAMATVEGVQRDGLAVGDSAAPIAGSTPDGERVVLDPSDERPRFLLFVAPDCGPCDRVLPYVMHLAKEPQIDVAFRVVVAGPVENVRHVVDKYRPPFTMIAEDGSGTAERYRVRVTPFGFVVGEDGEVRAKGLCNGPKRLRDLLIAGGLGDVGYLLAAYEEAHEVSLLSNGRTTESVEVV